MSHVRESIYNEVLEGRGFQFGGFFVKENFLLKRRFYIT